MPVPPTVTGTARREMYKVLSYFGRLDLLDRLRDVEPRVVREYLAARYEIQYRKSAYTRTPLHGRPLPPDLRPEELDLILARLAA